MLPYLALLAITSASSPQIPIDQPPRLRTLLDNGAIVLVEPMPREKVISVQFFASSRRTPESEATHGYRHLLEHLLVRGDGSLDRRLESQACFLNARTYRDAMQIELTVGPNQLELALDTISSLLRRPAFSQEQIDRELRVMRDEFASLEAASLLGSAAWRMAFGEAGLDPLGTVDSVFRATPEKLEDIYGRQFAADGLVLAIAGPVDMDAASKQAIAVLAPKAKPERVAPPARRGRPGRTDSTGFGEARGAIVSGFNTPSAMGALAAALAVANEFPSAFVTYTPAAQDGLVLVGRTDSNSGIGLYVDRLDGAADLFPIGKLLAREWLLRQLRTAPGTAYLRGLLLCQGAANRPETMLELIDALTPAQFAAGIRALQTGHAVISVGAR